MTVIYEQTNDHKSIFKKTQDFHGWRNLITGESMSLNTAPQDQKKEDRTPSNHGELRVLET